MNINSFPDDIIYIIINKINSYNSMCNLKQTCHIFNNIISKKNIIIRMKLENKIELENKKHRKLCINNDCYNLYLLKNVQLLNSNTLCNAYSINNTYIYINDKKCNIYSPYCQSCFIENVLIGDKKNNYSSMGCEGFIDFYYIPE